MARDAVQSRMQTEAAACRAMLVCGSILRRHIPIQQ
jgi:hypothetical protein